MIREQCEKGDKASQLGLPWMGLEVSARSWQPHRPHISASTYPCELKILTLEISGLSGNSPGCAHQAVCLFLTSHELPHQVFHLDSDRHS